METDESCPTLTYNLIHRHQSRIVRTRIASNKSPWLSLMDVGDVVNVPISHGEGRFVASEELIRQLPDGRVFGKMGHSERIGHGLYQNVPGNYDNRMFEAAVRYFR